jgi:predicted outer membrane repeat protein
LGSGGGISFTVDQDDPTVAPRVDIGTSTIDGNSARRAGGGLWIGIVESSEPTAPSTIVSLSNTNVRDNTTIGDDVPGGGIAVLTGSLALSTVEITGNIAGQGGVLTGSHGGGVYFREAPADAIVDPHDLLFGGVLFADNSANGRGGGIEMVTGGRIEATQVRFVDNTAATLGGGVFASTTVDVDGFVVSGNSAVDGGGMFLSGGSASTVSLLSGTVASNSATGRGGGIFVDDPTSVDVTNVTVHGNSAPRGGGLMLGSDPMSEGAATTLDHVTLTSNSAAVGANMAIDVGDLIVGRSVIAEPAGGGTNCDSASTVTSQGRSFLSDASCGSVATDVVSVASPLLGALADNGGFSPTRLPGVGSPVLGTVPAGECALSRDQRGTTRPQGPACEAGSVEADEGNGGPAPIVGTSGADTLIGTNGDDLIQGLGGRDLLRGRGGNDELDGGADNDVLLGAAGDDILDGRAGNDLLIGGPGTDILRGGAGRDVLIAVDSNDVLIGGPGRDLCFFVGAFLPRDC